MVDGNCDFRIVKDTFVCAACGYVATNIRVLPIRRACPAWQGNRSVPAAIIAPIPRSACQHFAAESRRAACETCAGQVQVKVFACGVYGECTLAKKIGSLACCAACERYEPVPTAP